MALQNGDFVLRIADGKKFGVGRERSARQDPTMISKTISVGFAYQLTAEDGETVQTNDGEITSLHLFRRLSA